LIKLFLFFGVYIGIGMAYNIKMKGLHGIEAIPNKGKFYGKF